MQHSTGFMELVNQVKNQIKELDVKNVKNKLDSSSTQLVLIDVRETEEWDEGFIPGAIHLSKGIIERDIEKIIPNKNSEIILYCGGGYRSMLAADNIQKMGYNNVISMSGGIKAWVNANYPIDYD